MTRRPFRATLLAGVLAVGVSVAACGTTVPQTTQLSSGAVTTSGTTAEQGASGTDPGSSAALSAGAAPAAAGASKVGGTTTSSGGSSVSAAVGTGPAAQAQIGSTGPVVVGSRTATPTATGAARGGAKASAKPAASSSAKPSAGKSGAATTGLGGSAPASTLPPIKVGFMLYDNSSTANSLGATDAATVNDIDAMKALVSYTNAHGGLNGRQINPDYDVFNTGDSNYQADAAAACAKFTSDDHVDVVLDLTFGPGDGFESCLQKAGIVDINDQDRTDAGSIRALSLSASTFNMSLDRAYGNEVGVLAASGYISKKNKIGVVMDTCASTVESYKNTILPAFAKAGLSVSSSDTVGVNCPSGTADEANDAAQVENSVVKFETDGVDRVMFISGLESTGVYLFAETADSQMYHPGYMVSSYGEAGPGAPQLPAGQRAQLHGAGWEPTLDVTYQPGPLSQSEQSCLDEAKAGGVTPGSFFDDYFVWSPCGLLLLLQSALKADGGVTTGSTLIGGVHALGNTFQSPGIVNDATDYSGSKLDGPTQMREFAYDTGCSCVKYISNPITVP